MFSLKTRVRPGTSYPIWGVRRHNCRKILCPNVCILARFELQSTALVIFHVFTTTEKSGIILSARKVGYLFPYPSQSWLRLLRCCLTTKAWGPAWPGWCRSCDGSFNNKMDSNFSGSFQTLVYQTKVEEKNNT